MFYSRYNCLLKQHWNNHIHVVQEIHLYIFEARTFFRGFRFPVTQICQSVDLVANFSSLLFLS